MTKTQIDRLPHEMLIKWGQEKPDDVFLRQNISGRGRTYTFSEAARELQTLAAWLRDNFEGGSRIGICGTNSPRWILADYAIALSGMVSVPFYPKASRSMFLKTLAHSQIRALIWDRETTCPEVQSVIPKDLDTVDMYTDIQARLYDAADGKSWDEIIESPFETREFRRRNGDELATIMYTSGTSGEPKGVMHKFSAQLAGVEGVMHDYTFDKNERFFSYLPLAHAAERLLIATVPVYLGAPITFLSDLDNLKEDLRSCRPTVFLAVPRVWEKIEEKSLRLTRPFRKLRWIPGVSLMLGKLLRLALGLNKTKNFINGSAALPATTRLYLHDLGFRILEGYGMTENFAYSHLMRPWEYTLKGVGRPCHGVECKIDDAQQVLIKSPTNLMGYFREEATGLDAEGYFATGDLGEINERCELILQGRLSEQFKTSKGKFISPTPIEGQLKGSALIEALFELSELAFQLPKEQVMSGIEEHVKTLNRELSPHERIGRILVSQEPWSIESHYLTPTMKVRRKFIREKCLDHLAQKTSRLDWLAS
jgi:long-chain acyl-CoA synthetase